MRSTIARVLVPVLGIALMLSLGGCGLFGSGSHTVTAYFTSSSGVFVGNDVGVLGVPVGKITSITPHGKTVKVTMSVNSDQDIPANAAAVVVPRSVATDRYIALTPAYTGGAKMPDGGVIPASRTRVPVEFDEVLNELNHLATSLAGNKRSQHAIRGVISSLSTTLKGNGGQINKTIRAFAQAMNGLSAQRGTTTQTLASLDKLVNTIAKNQGTVREFIHQVSTATSILATERGNFRTALNQVTKMIRVVANFVRTNRTAIDTTVRNSNDIFKTVLSRRQDVAEILRDLPLTAENLQRTIHNHQVRVVLPLKDLLNAPLGKLIQTLCQLSPGVNLCGVLGNLLDNKNLDVLTSLLANLLGGQ